MTTTLLDLCHRREVGKVTSQPGADLANHCHYRSSQVV